MRTSSRNREGETAVEVAPAPPTVFRRSLRTGVLVVMAVCTATIAEETAVEICRKSASDAERIACLEAALSGRPEASDDAIGPDTEPGPHPEPRPSDRREPDRSGAANPDSVDGIGARQVRLRNQTSADLDASLETARGLRVAKYAEVPYRRLQVELENGQVWRQITGDTQRLRVDLERNQTVDIEESRISGYRLRLNEIGRIIRVERIR